MLSLPQRRDLRRLAIRSYRAQTYERRTLIMAGDDEMTSDAIRSIIHIPAGTIGARRNAAIEQIESEWIAHWDDDDWSALERLAAMISAAREADAPAVGLRSMWFDDGQSAWLYRGARNWHVCGTSLLYRRDVWRAIGFRDLQIGEDVEFARELDRRGWLLSLDQPHLMVARDHGSNTSPRNRDCPQWQRYERSALPEQYLEALSCA